METEIGLTKKEIEDLCSKGYIFEFKANKYKFLGGCDCEDIIIIENGR